MYYKRANFLSVAYNAFNENSQCDVIYTDFSKGFDRVNHDLLMHKIGLRIKDKLLMRLIGRYLRARIIDNGKRIKPSQGVPQGGPLSPLLSNIMLDELDQTLEQRGHHFARYADEFTILVKSQRAGERVLASISLFLQQQLNLVVNDEKSRVGEVKDTKFGEKLHIPVLCGGKDYIWTCNNTTRTFIVDSLGKDETKWIGKTIELEIVKTQTSNGLTDALYPKGAL